MISDELLRAALIASFEERMALCEREIKENPHRFSLAYKIRKRSIIRLARRYEETKEPPAERHFMPLRRLALIIAIIAAAVILSVGAYAAYLIINGFVFDVHETYSNITIDFSEYDIKNTITEVYGLSNESGAESIYRIVEDKMVTSKYKFKGKNFVFTQYSKDIAYHDLYINTETSYINGTGLNKYSGFIVTRRMENEDDRISIVWMENGYIFSLLSSELTENELTQVTNYLVIEEYIK